MNKRIGWVPGLAALMIIALGGLGCEPKLRPEKAKDAGSKLPPARVDLPAQIALEGTIPPETHPDGRMRVDGLLARKDKYLGQKLLVRGFLVAKYECPKDAKRCEHPHGWLADSQAGGDKRLLLVGISEAVRDALEVGQSYVVTGRLKTQSGGGFVNSAGLLVYESIEGLEVDEPDGKGRRRRRKPRFR